MEVKYEVNQDLFFTITDSDITGVSTTNNNKEIIITTGSLKSGENKKVNINLWIDENVSKDKEHHFHGYFKVERIEDINEN